MKGKRLAHPSVEEIERGLSRWHEKHPDDLKVEVRGNTAEGRPVLLCRITNHSVPDDDKQVALFTACHTGGELNPCTGLLHVVKWLISNDAQAVEIRRKQIVLVIPCCNPDAYELHQKPNTQGGITYTCWDWDEVATPEKNPEAMAIKSVMDEYMPDIHVDVHGVKYDKPGFVGCTGISPGSALSRSYISGIPRLMNEAVEAAGFLMSFGEQSSGKVLASAPVPGADHHFYRRSYTKAEWEGTITAPIFSYHNYHSISFIIEAGFDQDIVIRLRRLLQIGNEIWRGECYPGYPANQVAHVCSMAVAACGTTAKQRRTSRVELWRKLRQLKCSIATPQCEGTIMACCATMPQAAKKFLGSSWPIELAALVERFKSDSRFNAKVIADFFVNSMSLRHLAINSEFAGLEASEAESSPIQNGIALRLFIPYRSAEITHLCLDGHPVVESATDGYQLWRNPGTIIQVNIPPAKVCDFHVVTCAYDPRETRRSGFSPEDWNE